MLTIILSSACDKCFLAILQKHFRTAKRYAIVTFNYIFDILQCICLYVLYNVCVLISGPLHNLQFA